ncbi:acetoacetyl-CoA synthetase [Trichonephila clavipes]|nr:acetoacetyl-CoA synthetase [Trichonephila clavipes]
MNHALVCGTSDDRIRVRRYANELCLLVCIIEGYSGLTPGVMVWVGFRIMDDPICYELRVTTIATGTSVKCHSPNSFPSFKRSLELSFSRIIHGHMFDEALNPKGCRFGPSEIYKALETTLELLDCLCVPQYGKNMDERAVLFLKIKEGYSFNQDLVSRVKKVIEKNCSFKHVPEVVLEVKDIPVRINQSHVLQKLGILLNKE